MAIADQYAGIVVDLDGGLLRRDELIRPAASYVRKAGRAGLPLVFVTNDSTRTPDEWVRHVGRQGLELDAGQIVTSATATAHLLDVDPPPRCFVIGEYGLSAPLRTAGVDIVEDQEDADTVVVGADQRLTYAKLRGATLAIRRGARFVATNGDAVYPAADGHWPGTGATLAYLRTSTGVAPEIVGKPQSHLLSMAEERLEVDGPVLVVGDRVDTDVAAARRVGWDSALVLSGEADWTSLIGAEATPTWVIDDLSALGGPEPPVVRHAREADLSSIRTLLQDVGFDVSGAARRLQDTLVAEGPDGAVVGTASWEMVDQAAHLRGITVDRRERRHGAGSHLVVRALDELHRDGVDWVYLLTPGADEMFEGLGFWRVHRDRVPEEVLETAQFGAAATGGRALVRRLRGE